MGFGPEWALVFFGSQVESLGYLLLSLAPGHGGCEKVPLGTLRIASEAKAEDTEKEPEGAMAPTPPGERIRNISRFRSGPALFLWTAVARRMELRMEEDAQPRRPGWTALAFSCLLFVCLGVFGECCLFNVEKKKNES